MKQNHLTSADHVTGVESIAISRRRSSEEGIVTCIATSFDEAEAILASWSVDYPTTCFQKSDAITFTVRFRNGIVWNGKFRLHYGGMDHHDRLLREAVLESLQYASGYRQPPGLSREAYLQSLANLGLGVVTVSRRLLEEGGVPLLE